MIQITPDCPCAFAMSGGGKARFGDGHFAAVKACQPPTVESHRAVCRQLPLVRAQYIVANRFLHDRICQGLSIACHTR